MTLPTTTNNLAHEPVLVQEVIAGFSEALLKGGQIIDATLGYAGHSLALIGKGAKVLGIEYDQRMLKLSQDKLEELSIPKGVYKLVHGNFKDILNIAQDNGFFPASGVLFDLGVSNVQLMHPEYGFSFANPEAVLDMRADSHGQVKAYDLLNILRKDQLEELFRPVLTRGMSRGLVAEIIKKRNLKPFRKVGDLLEVIDNLGFPKGKINPATKIFLALRMTVNSEVENLREALPKAMEVMRSGGRLLVITFHSGEDRVVKDLFEEFEGLKKGEILTKKPILATESEIAKNPKARSAKLRIIRRI